MSRTASLAILGSTAFILTLVLAGCGQAAAREPSVGQPSPQRRLPPKDRFPTLDAYLAFLEKRAQLGGSWYRQVQPGLYRRETGGLKREGGEARDRLYTREELAWMFGYDEAGR